MATRYQLKIHPQVISEDLPALPKDLQVDFQKIFKPVLQLDPHNCASLPCHDLKGKLLNCKALEVAFEGDKNEYRLVYRIFEKPSPRHVAILSFGKHDLAYEMAQARRKKK